MRYFSLLVVVIMLAGGCKKDDTVLKFTNYANLSAATTKQFDGTYNGQFISTQTGAKPVNLTVQLIISGNQFNSGMGDLGAGIFLFNNKIINFEDDNAFATVARQGEDISYAFPALSGDYNYTIKGDSLLLSQTQSNGLFVTYKLKK